MAEVEIIEAVTEVVEVVERGPKGDPGDGANVEETDPVAVPLIQQEVSDRESAVSSLSASITDGLAGKADDADLDAEITARQNADDAKLAKASNLSDLANAATARSNLGLGTAATHPSSDYQPVDSDLTAIAALTTTSFGRGLLTAASASAARSTLGARSVIQGDLPSGAVTQTFSRTSPSNANTSISGNHLWVTGGDAILPAGVTCNSITIWSSTGAASAPTAQVFYLINKSLAVLARTSDDGTTAWAANAGKTLNLTAPYTPTVDTPVYIGILVVATTQPTLIGAAGYNSNIVGISPPSYGRSTTNTTPSSITTTVATVTVNGTPFYAYVS